MFYGLRSVKTVLADLTGFPSVAVCCGKLRENVSVGECCSGASGTNRFRRREPPSERTRCAFSSGQRVCSAAACIKNTVHIKKVLQTAKRCGKYFARCVCKMI